MTINEDKAALDILRQATKAVSRKEGEDFGNFEETRGQDGGLVRIISDRGQIFIDIGSPHLPGRWFDFRDVAKVLGLAGDAEAICVSEQVALWLKSTKLLSMAFTSDAAALARKLDEYATARTQPLKNELIRNRPNKSR